MGYEYEYKIYSTKQKDYYYKVTEYQITIEGQQEKKSKVGVIKNIQDLKKLTKKEKDYNQYIYYQSTIIETIEELGKKLFP